MPERPYKTHESTATGFHTYIIHFVGGFKYIGYSGDVHKRIKAHIRGDGAMCTRPLYFNSYEIVGRHNNKRAAKNAERRLYYKLKAEFGENNVRGAGHTKRFN